MKKPLVICLMGPTASGKTALAITLHEKLPCEIISVDSGMIYRGMDVGTAKPSKEELAIAPHRLIDICDPSESYSAGQFRRDAIKAIEDILAAGSIPLLVGGTMLYFRVLEQGIATLPEADPGIRAEIKVEAEAKGWNFLHKKLMAIDPVFATKISANDSQRIARALEINALTGKTITELHQNQAPLDSPYEFLNIAIAPKERSTIWQRIEHRFVQMLQYGFIDEVAKLYARGDLNADMPSMRTVGYRQIWQYLAGQITKQEMLERVPIATRQLAKRQFTWLRSWNDLHWIDSDAGMCLEKILRLIAK